MGKEKKRNGEVVNNFYSLSISHKDVEKEVRRHTGEGEGVEVGVEGEGDPRRLKCLWKDNPRRRRRRMRRRRRRMKRRRHLLSEEKEEGQEG